MRVEASVVDVLRSGCDDDDEHANSWPGAVCCSSEEEEDEEEEEVGFGCFQHSVKVPSCSEGWR